MRCRLSLSVVPLPSAAAWSTTTSVPPGLSAANSAALALSPVPSGKGRSEEHTSELQSLMRISYAVFCLKKKKKKTKDNAQQQNNTKVTNRNSTKVERVQNKVTT